jgi:hypothetical protein
MQFFTTGRDNEAAHRRVTAVHRGDDPASATNDGDQRLDVIGLQPRVGGKIDISHGDHGVDVAVAPVFRELHPLFEAIERLPLASPPKQSRAGRREDGIGQTRAPPGVHPTFDRTVPIEGRLIVAIKKLAGERLVHDAEDRLPTIEQGKQQPPMQHARHERARAIDRIDDPGKSITRLEPVLFAKHAVLGIASPQGLAKHLLCRAIGLGDGIETPIIALVLDREFGPEEWQRRQTSGRATSSPKRRYSSRFAGATGTASLYLSMTTTFSLPSEALDERLPAASSFAMIKPNRRPGPTYEPQRYRARSEPSSLRKLPLRARRSRRGTGHSFRADRSGFSRSDSREPEEEFRNAWRTIGETLAHAGLGYEDIIEYTSYHVGLQAHLTTFMKVRDEFISEPWPAWTAIGITELAVPGARVEIKVTGGEM